MFAKIGAWLAARIVGNFLPKEQIAAFITRIVTLLLGRVLDTLDRMATKTEFTIDDKVLAEVRTVLMKPGVIDNFTSFVMSLIFGDVPVPAPVDPLNPPAPEPIVPPAPARPGILRRIWNKWVLR